jgi:hypothetical protein
MHAGWAYFVSFPQAARDFAHISQTRLTTAVLTMGGEKSLGKVLGQQAKLVGPEVTIVVHRGLEERQKKTH